MGTPYVHLGTERCGREWNSLGKLQKSMERNGMRLGKHGLHKRNVLGHDTKQKKREKKVLGLWVSGIVYSVPLPIPEVEVLGLGLEVTVGSRATGVHQAILDVWREPLVVHCGQGPLVEPCKDSILVKVDVIPSDVMAVPHSEVAKLVGSGGHWVGLAEGAAVLRVSAKTSIPVEGEVRQVVILKFEVGFVPP